MTSAGKSGTKGVDHKNCSEVLQLGIFVIMLELLKKRWVYHILIWLACFTFIEIIGWLSVKEGNPWDSVGQAIVFVWPFIPIVYLNFYLKARLYDKRRYAAYFLSIPLQILIGVLIYQLDYLIFWEAKQSLFQDVSNVFFIIATSTGLQYFKRGIVNQYQLQELKAKNAEMELNSLKAQINPHFLFNNLNNIYAINQIDSGRGSEMIMELADVMRYHLQFSKQEKVSLSDEIQLIKSYIELEKLRLNKNCDLQIEIQEGIHSLFIAPLLLLPFIENAFKYGTHPKENCFVHLKLWIKDKELNFEIANTIIANKKVVKTHIGVNNTAKRLELLYPKKHQLYTDQVDEKYRVKLEIDL